MRLVLAASAAVLSLTAPCFFVADAQAQSIVETAALLRDRAMAGSPAFPILESLTTEIGARPAGSAAQKRAMEWGVAKLTALGFQNVHSEPFTITAWVRGPESAEVTAPYPQHLVIIGLGGSVPTPKEGIEAEIALFHTYADLLAAPAGSLTGKIAVVTQPMVRTQTGEGYGALIAMRTSGPSEAARRGAVAYLLRSLATSENRLPHTGATRYAADVPKIPAAALSVTDAELLDHMAARGQPIRIRLNLDSHTVPDAPAWNVVGEVVGRDKPDEVIVIGGHLDSWDPGTGAIDDGAGLSITTATAKLINDLPRHPRRTVRMVMFGSEEMGGAGEAYAARHKDEVAKIVLTGESDEGPGPVWAAQWPKGAMADPTMRAMGGVLAPLKVILEPTAATNSGSDVEGLQLLGVPVIAVHPDATHYFDIHHSADDTLDKNDPKALDQSVATWAALIYAAAESDIDFRAVAK